MKWLKGRFKYAFYGLGYALKDKSIALQMLFGMVVVICGFIFGLRATEWFMIGLCIMLVIVSEIFNSCIEKTVDYISEERSMQAKQIKDMAAAAVFLVSLFSAIVGLCIFVPKIL